MPEICVPQLGEGLREVRIVELLRKPGDLIHRGETLYVVETDKSTVELESPNNGRLLEWCASPGDVISIGSTVAIVAPIENDEPIKPPPSPGRLIPPRTRAHARARGLRDDQLVSIPSQSGKLLPSHIDAYIANRAVESQAAETHREYALGAVQRALVYRMRRSAAVVIPGTIAIEI